MTRPSIPKQPTIKVVIPHWFGDPVVRINTFIRQCSEPSFYRWTNVACLELVDRVITPPIVHSIVKFLYLPLAKDPSGTTDEELKWIVVKMKNCRIDLKDISRQHLTANGANDRYCTVDDVHALFSAMAHRALDLSFSRCPSIVATLARICHRDHFGVDILHIDQYLELSPTEYAKLGEMIGRDVQLKKLSLCLPFVDGTDQLFAGLSNLDKIQELYLEKEKGQDLADLVMGREGFDGPIMRLLRNSQNHLKRLSLNNMDLKDNHMIAVLDVIPTSQMQELEFCDNCIQDQGIVEFANLLPSMHSLKHFRFRWSGWIRSPLTEDDRDKVRACLLKGVRENTCIETLGGISEKIRQGPLFWYYLALNRGGRRILTSSKPVPDGLWPYILERAGETDMYIDFYSASGMQCDEIWASVNAVYYLLQNCLRILLSS